MRWEDLSKRSQTLKCSMDGPGPANRQKGHYCGLNFGGILKLKSGVDIDNISHIPVYYLYSTDLT